MQSSSSRRARQSAIRIFAQEYMDASLPEEGAGEFDPSFVVTKLGAKINRALVAGVIDRIERREGESGPNYSGVLRDPSGTHRFSVAAFQPELHADIEELLHRFDSGDRFLMMLVGRARWFESEDGGVFTSFRAEEFCVVDTQRYTNWLVETADATLRRLDAYEASIESDLTPSALQSSGVPMDLVDGLILARGHYGEFDTENYRVGVLQGLSMALSNNVVIEPSAAVESPQPTLDDSPMPSVTDSEPKPQSEPSGDVGEVILETIRLKDEGAGVDYDTLVHAAIMAGHSREVAEDAIDHLRDVDGSIIEPRFSFFQLLPE
ncbi:MAG TPA: hypothetical protein HA303_01200 [Candidatus Thalassarchaeaceae archaeon]|jgi:hypothetical protein|nr:hypothetical protein [Candidatus Thalassarchaeaceae archaeon]DAC36296.1 MAG TPA: hypothetical protein D7H79_01190 [Candidatus Poseidoniales archaeon]HIH79818.1 hypothetical protein [Candidatus Thalassarchaeaceae archaeon]HJM29973.1 hypothetical protein [Candidatus Thalassarchaeaceae archaeon]|tara:strand:- start:4419 stop:5381 length:963 start_codon:yes stop_codon:yes gene_type:complete